MLENIYRLDGKVIVITGAAGLLGRKHAEAIACYGGTPILLDLSEQTVNKLADELNNKYNIGSIGFAIDITNEDAIKKIKIVEKVGVTFSINNIIGFPDETRELAFDTIELNRKFNSDNTSCSILVPFHGTELHEYSVKKGYLDPNIICSVSNSGASILNMPQWHKDDIMRLRDVFAMYIKFPKKRWPEIERAETDLELRENLRQEFISTVKIRNRG